MKNHIAFKFIAVMLCALSLVGTLASAGSILVLTEMDLYNKTVDQVVAERLQQNGSIHARLLALHYASTTLGGVPADMAAAQYSTFGSLQDHSFGYTILDDQGNALESVNPEYRSSSATYTFTPTGQYMYLVETLPTEEAARQEENTLPELEDYPLPEGYVYFSAIPPQGIQVYGMRYAGAAGGRELSGETAIGFLFCNQNGQAVFRTYDSYVSYDAVYDEYVPFEPETVQAITFLDMDGQMVYNTAVPEGAGVLSSDEEGYLTFLSSGTDPIATVCEVVFLNQSGEQIYQVGGTPSIGQLYYDQEGYVVFRSDYAESSGFAANGAVAGAIFRDETGSTVCEAFAQVGVGEYSHDKAGCLVFRSSTPWRYESIPQEPIPTPTVETTGETVAETADETEGAGEVTDETTGETTDETGEAWDEDEENSSASAAPEATDDTQPTDDAPTEEPQATQEAETTQATQPSVSATMPRTEPTQSTPPVAPSHQDAASAEEPMTINGKPLVEYEINRSTYYDHTREQWMQAKYVYIPMPAYTVEMYLNQDSLGNAYLFPLLRIVRSFRSHLFLVLGLSLLSLAITAVYLCCAAARKPKSEEVRAGGLNRMPLDLYLALVIGGGVLLGSACVAYYEVIPLGQALQTDIAFSAAVLFAGCLLVVGFFFALVAQIKTPGWYWWHNSLCGRILRLLARIAVWLEKWLSLTALPWLWTQVKRLWLLVVRLFTWLIRGITGFFRRLGSMVNRFFSLLPLMWQWVAAGCAVVLILVISFSISGIALPVGIGICIAIVLYAAHAFGILLDSTRRMSKGDLSTQVPDSHLVGCFRQFAGELNALAGVAVVAAQKQLRSERMKTELITNVSHDIKTPLTSIINYADLLQKPHTEEQQAEYLEVLSRQSQQLRKLIEDLIEMSKASTGNMPVDVTQVDAVEAVNQALGEFNDKLEKANLVPVFRHTVETAPMMADGRLVWRVMSNVLSNAVKYAMPGTRVYVDLTQLEDSVVISVKNISREELSIDADELLERFVRGDDSRNTEGSGLGLNIAKSLMELQKGQLQLLVDGDLFKVTLIFPGA